MTQQKATAIIKDAALLEWDGSGVVYKGPCPRCGGAVEFRHPRGVCGHCHRVLRSCTVRGPAIEPHLVIRF
jgi:ribosomal protein S27AE